MLSKMFPEQSGWDLFISASVAPQPSQLEMADSAARGVVQFQRGRPGRTPAQWTGSGRVPAEQELGLHVCRCLLDCGYLSQSQYSMDNQYSV